MIQILKNQEEVKQKNWVNVHSFLKAGLYSLFIFSDLSFAWEMPWQNTELVIHGNYFRACNIAYQEFNKILENRANKVDNQQKHLSTIESYNIEVGAGKNNYYIYFMPRFDGKVPADFKGGAEYVIDATTFKIIESNY